MNHLKIDIGSGYAPAKHYSTCDITKLPYLDYIIENNKIFNKTRELNNNEVSIFRMRNCLHHIKDLDSLFQNLYKYLKINGKIIIIECRKEFYKANLFLDTLWYRYVIPRNEVWFSEQYRDYIITAKKYNLKVVSSTIDNEKEIIILEK